ncbi:type II toxin-antitoxin system RelE/ParE family toxin [Aggregatibacter actinomycetemcomitans]|uniref:type II toxin-antitoxin system RelE/ParE family toxin n=1 Tax=Aggregatibacter actinomycetemcomitans TaxID=714 RepID=UPI00197B69F2|nr:type II toxin-antitoxin system RelE/ParE family toxin [Aggregatibacter actinomycetemcomitans]MBN6068773.1 type II toxin-antitoxin system RelE/ParE family toxin [Aggregatibacter actinomycetemcomitans]MBN6086728.1 type II toxin-antitoxin system RelE/ParE family toxin [Aggregatibacter actinomycetemcomitans]
MRIFKTKAFNKFAQKNHILDSELLEAIVRAEQGLIDADLGGAIIKQRIAREGQGRSGGFRSFIFYRINENSYFVAGISKNARNNISAQELAALKELAKAYAALTPQQIELQIQNRLFIEVLPEGKHE